MKHYIAEGGFSQWLYKKVGETITVDGMTGKVVEKIDDNSRNHSGLPLYSNTSDFYIKISEEDGLPEQIRIFSKREACIDIDWNHPHKPFKIGDIHVHDYIKNRKGKLERQDARPISKTELKKYGELINKIRTSKANK